MNRVVQFRLPAFRHEDSSEAGHAWSAGIEGSAGGLEAEVEDETAAGGSGMLGSSSGEKAEEERTRGVGPGQGLGGRRRA